MSKIKAVIKANPILKRWALFIIRVMSPLRGLLDFLVVPAYFSFLLDWCRYRHAGGKALISDFYPCLSDKTAVTDVDRQYFYQAVWAFRRILKNKPAAHVDVGSDVRYVGMLTGITNITFVDIRPLELKIEGYIWKKGSILALPFPDDSVPSISSLHVLEHIGLGRYGDPIDPAGTEKACRELMRILSPVGKLFISIPIGRPRVQFNGQRVFSPVEVLSFFKGLQLIEMSAVNEFGEFLENINPLSFKIGDSSGTDFGIGLFIFEKDL